MRVVVWEGDDLLQGLVLLQEMVASRLRGMSLEQIGSLSGLFDRKDLLSVVPRAAVGLDEDGDPMGFGFFGRLAGNRQGYCWSPIDNPLRNFAVDAFACLDPNFTVTSETVKCNDFVDSLDPVRRK